MSSGGELELQKMCDEEAKARGWKKLALDVVQKRRATGTARGWPDRCYFRRGRVIVLEFKAEKDFKVSEEQQAWLEEWHRVRELAGFGLIMVAVVRPSDFDEVKGWFE